MTRGYWNGFRDNFIDRRDFYDGDDRYVYYRDPKQSEAYWTDLVKYRKLCPFFFIFFCVVCGLSTRVLDDWRDRGQSAKNSNCEEDEDFKPVGCDSQDIKHNDAKFGKIHPHKCLGCHIP